jgi:TP53 regulating kinase-like protein
LAKLLKKGAEASIYLGGWFGEKAIFKIREKKNFRIKPLDEKIRMMRTIREATFLSAVKRLEVSTPLVYFVDRKKAEIIMQYIQGERLKEIIDSDNKDFFEICRIAGKYVANIHAGNIIHGDLTTANFISTSKGLVLLDFGLSFHSQRLEDKAIDLHLLKMITKSAHTQKSDQILSAVLDGYSAVTGKSTSQVISRMKNIELRGRYK